MSLKCFYSAAVMKSKLNYLKQMEQFVWANEMWEYKG